MHQRQARRAAPVCQWWSDCTWGTLSAARVRHRHEAICELQRSGGRYALVTMCIGGGQGIAAIFERLDARSAVALRQTMLPATIPWARFDA